MTAMFRSLAAAILAFSAAAGLPAFPAGGAELIMLEQRGCAWCIRWHSEIGIAYPKTEAGRVAPLRRVDILEPWPDDLKDIRPERLTPTFVLAENGKEIARLRGYAGDEFFWVLLDEMLEKRTDAVSN